MVADRGNWTCLVRQAAETSGAAVELSAISESELPGLLEYLASSPSLPFRYVSVHAPSKERQLSEKQLVDSLSLLPNWVEAIVIHPDTVNDAEAYARLGRRLVIENMDRRKAGGQTVDQLATLFDQLPDAGLCFDIAHAKDVDPSMDSAHALLTRFRHRLRHVHLSSLDDSSHHISLTDEDEELFAPLLLRCRDVPWILEAPAQS